MPKHSDSDFERILYLEPGFGRALNKNIDSTDETKNDKVKILVVVLKDLPEA